MIFTYTQEERATLAGITKQMKYIIIDRANDIEDPGHISEEIIEDWRRAFLEADAKITAQLKALDKSRFNSLQTVEGIIEDARHQIEDGILFLYMHAIDCMKSFYQDEDEFDFESDPGTAHIKKVKAFDYDWEHREKDFITFKALVENDPNYKGYHFIDDPEKNGALIVELFSTADDGGAHVVVESEDPGPLFLLDSEEVAAWLADNVINQHIQAIADTPHLEKLASFLKLAVEGSAYTRGTVTDWIITAPEAIKNIASIRSAGTPKYHVSPNTMLSNALAGNDEKGTLIGDGKRALPVLNMGKKNEVSIYVNATLENMDAEHIKTLGKPWTEYDRAVLDGVSSICKNCESQGLPPFATADMIYREMTRRIKTEKVSPKQREEVTKSVEKMRKNIYVYADVTEELQARGIITNPEGQTEEERHRLVMDDFMITGRRYDNMAINGQKVSGWLFNKPLLLHYAELTGQIITVKGDVLDIKKLDSKKNITTVSIQNSQERIAVKNYLLRRVEIMRRDEAKAEDSKRVYDWRRAKSKKPMLEKPLEEFRNQSRVILFETLFEATGIIPANTRTKIKNYVYEVLDYWKAIGQITDYRIRKKAGAADAVVITI